MSRLTKTAFSALAAIFMANIYIGIFKGWGNLMPVSMVFHFSGGLFMALLLYSLYHSELGRLSQPFRWLVLVALTLSVGVFWEFSEYLANQTLTEPIYRHFHYHLYFMGDLDDTVQDLVMDTVGALAFVLLWFKQFKSAPGPGFPELPNRS